MSNRWRVLGMGTAIVLVAGMTLAARAGLPVKLSNVVSAADLEAEIIAQRDEIASGLASPDSFQSGTGKRQLATTQLAVLSQALAEHDTDTKLKAAAPAVRDAALQIRQAASYADAQNGLNALNAALEGHGLTSAKVVYDWAKLAKTRMLMESLRDRTDQIRKALRRSKDPAAESRQASTMAVLGLAVSAHAEEITNPSDRPMWNEWSLEFQREMTLTAAALRRQDAPAVLEHFKAAQASCDKCHETFKR